jgi:DNA-binding transcriptional LysR family regulator
MDLWQLKIFSKVIESGSFSRAGEIVHLSQPTVSSHIKDLEDHFECRLIDRLGKRAIPTKAGELLNGYAKRLLLLAEEAETSLGQFKGITKGSLTIGGSTIPGGYILPGIMGAFLKKYPLIKIALIIKDTREIIDSILDGNAEIAVTGAKSNHRYIYQEELLEDTMKLIVKNDHKWSKKKSVSFEELAEQAYISREDGSGTDKSIKKSFAEAGFKVSDLTSVAQMGNTASVCQGIKSGVGISILSTLAVKEELQSGQLHALDIHGVNLSRFFYLTWQKNRTLSPLSQAFVAFLKASCKEGCL